MSNSPVCIDASFILRLLQSRGETTVIRLYRSWKEAGQLLVAPTLLYYEVANALHRYTLGGYLQPGGAEALLQQVFRLGISLYGDPGLHLKALQVARDLGLPAAYDAHYLALAQHLNAEFWTADKRLFRAVQDRIPNVHLLEAE